MIAAVVFTVASLHFNDSRHYEQFNPGIGVEWAVEPVRVSAGAYRNSSARLSVYGSVSREWGGDRFGAGVEVGAVTGYKVPVLPLVFPFARVSAGQWDLKVNVLPTARPILGCQVRYRVN